MFEFHGLWLMVWLCWGVFMHLYNQWWSAGFSTAMFMVTLVDFLSTL